MTIVAPSILAANFVHLSDHLQQIKNDLTWLHLDVMDGHFVPELSFGAKAIADLREYCDLNMPQQIYLDAHLMVNSPDINSYLTTGVDNITLHYEAFNPQQLSVIIEYIKVNNINRGLAINPDSDLTDIIPFLPHIDLLLIMSVYPGQCGQAFIQDSIPRIIQARALINKHNPAVKLQIDGGINDESVKKLMKNKVDIDIAVVGSYIFNNNDPSQALKTIKNIFLNNPML